MSFWTFLLGTLAFLSLTFSILATFGFSYFEVETTTLPGIAISSGVLLAILTFNRDRTKIEDETKLKKDEISFEVISQSLDEVYDLLKDKNNQRVIWIRAARVLLWAKELGDSITHESIKNAYELKKERLRIKLYLLLRREPVDTERYESEPLPGAFFYGHPQWEDRGLTMEQAAIESQPAR